MSEAGIFLYFHKVYVCGWCECVACGVCVAVIVDCLCFQTRYRKLLEGSDATLLGFLSLVSKSQVHNRANKCVIKDEEEAGLSARAFTRL